MIRALSVAAVLSVALAAPAFAQDAGAQELSAADEVRIEAAAEAFAARMEAFGARAEAAAEAAANEEEAEAAIEALWAEYAGDVSEFAVLAASAASEIAASAVAEIDVASIVDETMSDPEVQAEVQQAMGIARNSAWTQPDPEQAVTYGLIADYAMHQALEEEAGADGEIEIEIDLSDLGEDLAEEAAENNDR
jgi:hypothetical protein